MGESDFCRFSDHVLLGAIGHFPRDLSCQLFKLGRETALLLCQGCEQA